MSFTVAMPAPHSPNWIFSFATMALEMNLTLVNAVVRPWWDVVALVLLLLELKSAVV